MQDVGENLPQTAKSNGSGIWPIGPQYKGDKPFAKRMRHHQSWYRSVLGLDYGTGPSPSSTSRYGNMLTEADGAAGRTFSRLRSLRWRTRARGNPPWNR